MYPLNMSLIEGVGFACANSEQEHKALSDAGYGPEFAGPVPEQEEKRKPGRPKKVE
jgi:hypothetical protein